MSAPVTLASLLNRWGQDVLPEELGQSMLDHGDADIGTRNFSFAAALAGGYGYRAYLAYLDPERLWQCVKQGDSVGVFMRYAASEEQAAATGKAYLPGAFADVEAQMMALRGFETGEEGSFALVNDSLAPTAATPGCVRWSRWAATSSRTRAETTCPCRRILRARWPAPWRTAPFTPPPPTRASAF